MKDLFLIVAIVIVLIVLVLQVLSFIKTKNLISVLQDFFPDSADYTTRECTINNSILNSSEELEQFIKDPTDRKSPKDRTEGDSDVSLVVYYGPSSKGFEEVLLQTNKYLCKNVGTSAELSVLQDICERKIDAVDTEIHNRLNTPLYLGLAGTFMGIIIGLSGIDFNKIAELSSLKYGIIAAMCASFLGLVLMLINSAIFYSEASSSVEYKKNNYYDFLRRELMPTLANDISTSLNSLKGVLGHFVDKFGKNLDSYADSAELLNENLDKQYLVLDQIQKLSLPSMATQISNSFKTLEDSSKSIVVFHTYQEELNATIKTVNSAVSQINTIISRFSDFADSLAIVVENQAAASELQQQFRESIETHFPAGSEGRSVWRQEFDYLTEDAKLVSKELNNQLTSSTEYIRNFVNNNHEFFESFSKIKGVLETLVSYSNAQSECYKDLKDEILSLRKDTKDVQRGSNQLTQELITAVNKMTTALGKLNTSNKE